MIGVVVFRCSRVKSSGYDLMSNALLYKQDALN